VFGSRKVGSIKLNDLEDYQITREDEDRAPATIDYELSVTKTMVTTAFDNDKVSGDALKPFRAVKRKCKKFSNARDRVVSVDEYVRLLDEAPRHLKLAIVLSYTTGMRKGEIRNLRWSHVDKKVGLILLTGDETKEGKAKAIPLNEHVLKAMTALPRGLRCQYVVQYKGKRIASKKGMKRSFVTACKEAKIPYGRKAENGITFHDLRRSAKTNMAKAGVPKAFRDAILGHASQDMDRHYLKLTGEDLIPMMDRYIDWLDAEISNLDHFLDQEAKKDSGTTPKSLSVASL
jgi:integrase